MMVMNSALRIPSSALESWLPDLDLNQDKQIQSLLCYRYTIGQFNAARKIEGLLNQSSRQREVQTMETVRADITHYAVRITSYASPL